MKQLSDATRRTCLVPHSSPEGKDVARQWLQELPPPATVLDVGAGAGTWAHHLRGLWPEARWTALEVHEPYVEEFGLLALYDEVVVCDVRLFGWQPYDLVIFGDVLEHLPLKDAVNAWDLACSCSPAVLASLPIVDYPQGAVNGNDHERHLVTWSNQLALHYLKPTRMWAGNEIGVYLCAS